MSDYKDWIELTVDKIVFPAGALILSLLELHPYWQFTMLGAMWLFGIYLQYNQSKLDEFVRFIQDNPESFTEEIVTTEAFKEWFIKIFESYVKTRGERKRKIIQDILLWYSRFTEDEMREFELEKILDALDRISLESVDFIRYLKVEIEPAWLNWCSEKAKLWVIPERKGGRGFEFWFRLYKTQDNPLTAFMYQQMSEKYASERERARLIETEETYIKISNRLQDEEIDVADRYREAIGELYSLNILKPYLLSTGWGLGSPWITNSYAYNFSSFWETFVRYTADCTA